MSNIKNLVFDMGGVLVDLDRQAAINAFCEMGFPEAASLLDPYLQRGVFLQMECGEITAAQFRQYIRSRITPPRDVADSEIDGALCKFLVGLPEYKLSLIDRLHKRFKIYMLSNNNPIACDFVERTMFTQQGHTIDYYFDDLFLSHRMKMLKPNEDIFREMERLSGIVPQESLFIDDAPANIETARRLGYQTYLAGENEDFSHLFENI